MSFDFRKPSVLLAIIALVLFFLVKTFFLKNDRVTINDHVYLEFESDSSFSIYSKCQDVSTIQNKARIRQVGKRVDSLIISNRYGTFFYGLRNKDLIRKWYYINASHPSMKEISGGWQDSIFRNNEIEIFVGLEHLDSVVSPKVIWNSWIES